MIFRCILLVLSTSTLVAQNCAPEALHSFAGAWKLSSAKPDWYRECSPTATGSNLDKVFAAWAKLQPNKPLTVVYSSDFYWQSLDAKLPLPPTLEQLKDTLKPLKKDYDHAFQLGKPYLWVGTRQGGFHMALVYPSESTVRLVSPNTIDPDTNQPFEEVLDYKELMTTTMVMLWLN